MCCFLLLLYSSVFVLFVFVLSSVNNSKTSLWMMQDKYFIKLVGEAGSATVTHFHLIFYFMALSLDTNLRHEPG